MKRNDLAEYLFHQGTNFSSYKYLGCNREMRLGKEYFVFRVWAPNADKVELVSDISGWDKPLEMDRITAGGLWEKIIPFDKTHYGKKYKYKIIRGNMELYKGDPYALYSTGFDDGASIIYDSNSYKWNDEKWLEKRKNKSKNRDKYYLSEPINIYEMHIGSFMKDDSGKPTSYRALAEILPEYLKKMSYTHVEFLPLQEFPFDGSWGYQVCGFYSITSRYGSPDDFKFLIDSLHNAGIGVILDFVMAHFPKDAWGLYEFDGTPLYEYQGLDRQESKMWGTRFFDLGRPEVQSFLISAALYFLRELHIDGLRVDAVASMIYLDYDRADGEWIPNEEGTNENYEAIAFFKKMNSAIYEEIPDALIIAEESGSYGKITGKVSDGKLGFSLKWNMGFANDFYDYLATDPIFRKYKHKALNFPITYAFSENYCLAISHDEVVHGKKSFSDKVFGTLEEKLLESRTALLYFMTFPGKKLAFMGYEFAQIREWDHKGELEWFMLDFPHHNEFREYVSALNYFYLCRCELWEIDFSIDGFEWISCDENEKNVICYKRRSKGGGELLVALNFSGSVQRLIIPDPKYESLRVVFDTGNIEIKEYKYDKFSSGIVIDMPARSGSVLEDSSYIFKYLEDKGDK